VASKTGGGETNMIATGEAIPLCDFRPGDVGRVVKIRSKADGRLFKLSTLGIVPGSLIRCQQRLPAYVIWVGETQLSLEKAVAQDIWLQKL
jgi:DtxR family Mn-dependent transcriptional regulator